MFLPNWAKYSIHFFFIANIDFWIFICAKKSCRFNIHFMISWLGYCFYESYRYCIMFTFLLSILSCQHCPTILVYLYNIYTKFFEQGLGFEFILQIYDIDIHFVDHSTVIDHTVFNFRLIKTTDYRTLDIFGFSAFVDNMSL